MVTLPDVGYTVYFRFNVNKRPLTIDIISTKKGNNKINKRYIFLAGLVYPEIIENITVVLFTLLITIYQV